MVVGRCCRASERGKQSPKKNRLSHIQEGCSKLNWYSTPANYNFLVYFDRYFVSVLFEEVDFKNMYILTGTFYGMYSLD
jgi:hypothetical protein